MKKPILILLMIFMTSHQSFASICIGPLADQAVASSINPTFDQLHSLLSPSVKMDDISNFLRSIFRDGSGVFKDSSGTEIAGRFLLHPISSGTPFRELQIYARPSAQDLSKAIRFQVPIEDTEAGLYERGRWGSRFGTRWLQSYRRPEIKVTIGNDGSNRVVSITVKRTGNGILLYNHPETISETEVIEVNLDPQFKVKKLKLENASGNFGWSRAIAFEMNPSEFSEPRSPFGIGN